MTAAREGNYDKRLGKVETELARLDSTMTGVQDNLRAVGGQVDGIDGKLDRLIENNAARGEGLTLKTIGVFAASLLSLAAFCWALVAASPSVRELQDRTTKIDDPVVGRMPRLEKRTDELERMAWPARVTRN